MTAPSAIRKLPSCYFSHQLFSGTPSQGFVHAVLMRDGQELHIGLKWIQGRRQACTGARQRAKRIAAELANQIKLLLLIRVPRCVACARNCWILEIRRRTRWRTGQKIEVPRSFPLLCKIVPPPSSPDVAHR